MTQLLFLHLTMFSLIVRQHLVVAVVVQIYSFLLSGDFLFSLFSLSHLSISSFEFHAVTVTCPLKLNIIVIYRPPSAIGELLNELDTLIS